MAGLSRTSSRMTRYRKPRTPTLVLSRFSAPMHGGASRGIANPGSRGGVRRAQLYPRPSLFGAISRRWPKPKKGADPLHSVGSRPREGSTQRPRERRHGTPEDAFGRHPPFNRHTVTSQGFRAFQTFRK